ncbi:MAG: hypothetical protein OJF49_001907 [Ktedonobacterales bacterium]|nr:MAG: hypothetical protein OJF49_001907 [Ktedonobacterales bacterium]
MPTLCYVTNTHHAAGNACDDAIRRCALPAADSHSVGAPGAVSQSILDDGTFRTTLPVAGISREVVRWAVTIHLPHPARYQVIHLECQQFARQHA